LEICKSCIEHCLLSYRWSFRVVNSEKITETLKRSTHRPINKNLACRGCGSVFGWYRYERSHPGLILDGTPAIMSNFNVALLSPSR
jgi:hypothetical protein